ncbi:hypothetical protein FJZ53_00600 [Candidatus Woesearchaeota archaeon]|nr:hypothetical protein [Candidatus Woesearchaeota archaeon]
MKQAKVTPKVEREYERIIEKAAVDCYDENEAFCGMLCTLGDELEYPFDAKLLGETVKVTGIDDKTSSLKAGVIMNVSFKGKKHKAALATIDILGKSLKGKNAKLIGAYNFWVKQFYF